MGEARVRATGSAPAGPRDPAFAWFCATYFLLNFGQGVFPPLLPQIMEGLSLDFAAAGLLGSAFGLARFATDVPAGLLVERRGAGGVLHAGIACLLAGTLLSAAAPSATAMLGARALVGAGSGMTIVVAILFLMRRGPAGQRTRRGNLYEVGVIGGTAASAWLGGATATRLGWRAGFGLAALALLAAWLLAAARVLPAARPALARVAPEPAGQPPGRATPWAALVAIYGAVFALAVAWAGGVTTFLPLYGGRALGLSAASLGAVMSVAYGVEAALLVPVGWAADAFGRVRILVPGLLVMGAGALLVPRTASGLGFTVAATLVVVGITVWMVPPVLLAERLPGGFRGRAAGLYRFVSDLAYIVAPGTIGWLVGRHGFRTSAAVMAAVFGLAALLAALALGPEPRAGRPG